MFKWLGFTLMTKCSFSVPEERRIITDNSLASMLVFSFWDIAKTPRIIGTNWRFAELGERFSLILEKYTRCLKVFKIFCGMKKRWWSRTKISGKSSEIDVGQISYWTSNWPEECFENWSLHRTINEESTCIFDEYFWDLEVWTCDFWDVKNNKLWFLHFCSEEYELIFIICFCFLGFAKWTKTNLRTVCC